MQTTSPPSESITSMLIVPIPHPAKSPLPATVHFDPFRPAQLLQIK